LRASLFSLLWGFSTVRCPPVILSEYIQHAKGKRSRQENQACAEGDRSKKPANKLKGDRADKKAEATP
jgi:hypothetical protein